jgi:hypothetical protein
VDAGRGDVPLKDLRFRCAKCGSRHTNHVTMARDALGVQPVAGQGEALAKGSAEYGRSCRCQGGCRHPKAAVAAEPHRARAMVREVTGSEKLTQGGNMNLTRLAKWFLRCGLLRPPLQ